MTTNEFQYGRFTYNNNDYLLAYTVGGMTVRYIFYINFSYYKCMLMFDYFCIVLTKEYEENNGY